MAADLTHDLKKLADSWCERHALVPLHHFLPGYFALNGLTDGFGALETALKDVLAFAKSEITPEEKKEVQRILVVVQTLVYRQ